MKEKKPAEASPATPMLKQYFEIKAQYPEAILLYRVGDFYETYGDDALKASRLLGIVLTRKSSGGGSFIEMAGIPYHAIDNYLPRLVQAGCKVAVCDQLEDPKLTKKLVKRGVTELVTPGVAYNDNLLKAGENNWLAALSFSGKEAGMAFLDISTGSFRLTQGSLEYADVLLSTMAPHEILVERSFLDGFRQRFGNRACITPLDPWTFVPEAAYKKVCSQLETGSLKGFGVEGMPQGIAAAGAILFYLEMTQHTALGHIKSLSRIDEGAYVWMDRFTLRNLEVFQSLAGAEGRSLIEAVDRCCTPMGKRLLRAWLSMPLKDIARLNERYDTVDAFLSDGEMRTAVREELGEVGDLERIVAKAAAGRLLPREALQLARALHSSAAIRATIAKPELAAWCESLDDCTALSERITRTLLPDAAAALGKGDVIAAGISADLDTLRDTLHNGRQILLDIQQRERDATGISSLKIGYNNVFGYYLEVRNAFKDKVPAEWIRKQTLVGAERYITAELKQYEETILGAEQRILELETRLYGELVEAVRREIPAIQHNAGTLAQLDVLAGFALLADDRHYCRPVLDDSLTLDIKQGRHPVIEQLMPDGEEYVANDLHLDSSGQQIIILTGPNMAGKSAFLRQTALICLLAQTGCFVPAKSLKMGIVDKIFTRVGASDNISRGESTFMVEMLETATILNNLSDRSLVLLDEIGRGTSTFDGMSIAWSIVEYLHARSRAKTLFATHYHELNELEKRCARVRNYHIAVKEMDGQVIFLRKLQPGGVAHSFGIHVARLAGMPSDVVYRAEKKLRELESAAPDLSGERAAAASQGVQLSLYQLDDPLLLDIKDELARMDINKMSPLDAFDALRGLKKKIGL
ncbi:MAG: DNA mismatch repair protein MutS [Bacteroidales bacterium]|nr:DNA mismatch repair protein MutS [Bacteroidales bacterium]MBQ2599160.1 DNA mismatch repair protein MutS [Bacteroidales bacterium]MBQ4013050.1 DNA mismatch repair protein MutS [Bacteroidales bacterium]